jgi:hypothetical protein
VPGALPRTGQAVFGLGAFLLLGILGLLGGALLRRSSL